MRIAAPLRPALALCASLLSASCDSPSGPGGPGAPARLDLVSGNAQQGTVGAELPEPLVVRVLDGRGRPLSGQTVNFRVVSGGGSVAAGTAQTDARGEARERWVLGTSTADSQWVEVNVLHPTSGQPLVFDSFRATAVAGAPASIVPVGSTARAGTTGAALADSLAVQLRDQYGNAVPQAAVAWAVRSGGGTISPATASTDAQGIARAAWTLGTRVDSVQMAEAAGGLMPALTTEFTATAGIAMGAQLVVRSGGGQTGTVGTALAQPVKVALVLPYGAPIAGATISWMSMGTVSPQTSATDANGEAATTWTLGTMGGVQGLAASAHGVTPVTVNATAQAGPAAQVLSVSGDGQVGPSGQPLAQPLVVRVADQYGNGVADAPVAFAVTAGGGSVSPVTGTTDAAGRFGTTWTLGATSARQTVRASSGGLPPVTFTATVASSIGITIVRPPANTVVADSFFLVARGSSSQVVSATATVEGGGAFPLRLTIGPEFSGWITMPAGTPGPREIVVRAAAANGDSAFARMNVILDRPPQITVAAPVAGYVARPELRVDAGCTDDDPAGCRSLVVYLNYEDTPAASGVGELHATVSMASLEGTRPTVRVRGTDSRGQRVEHSFHIFVESSPRLVEIATAAAGLLWDYDEGRLLYAEPITPWTHTPNDNAVRVQDRASGELTTLSQGYGNPSHRGDVHGFLHSRGAIFVGGGGIIDWRNGSSRTLSGRGELIVAGSWAAWNQLYRMNLLDGRTVQVAGYEASTGGYDVADNGDVVWWSNSYIIYRYRDGAVQQISNPGGGLIDVHPKTDGINVVFKRRSGSESAIMMAGPAGTVELAPLRHDGTQQYEVENGWAAFTLDDAAAVTQIWIRSPSGETRQATFRGSSSFIEALGPDGELAFASGGRRYVVLPPYTGTPVEIGSARFEGDPGRLQWRNGELILFLGRSAFRVSYY